jgi:hypothetical protein
VHFGRRQTFVTAGGATGVPNAKEHLLRYGSELWVVRRKNWMLLTEWSFRL